MPDASRAFSVDNDGGHLVSMWQRINGKDTNASLDIVERETLSGIAIGERYPAAYAAVVAHDAEAALGALDCPVLAFAGTNDVLHGQLDSSVALLKHGEKHELPNAGTFVCETHSDDVAHLLREFFPGEAR